MARWATVAGSVLAIAPWRRQTARSRAASASVWTGILLLATVVIILDGVLKLNTVTDAEHLRRAERVPSHRADVRRLLRRHRRPGRRLTSSPTASRPIIRTYQYFSFTTLTTLGYGDFTAGGSFGRAVAVLEALTGQIFLATLVARPRARLVSAYRRPCQAATRRPVIQLTAVPAPPELAARVRPEDHGVGGR